MKYLRSKVLITIALLAGLSWVHGCAYKSTPITKPSPKVSPSIEPSPAPATTDQQAPLPAPEPPMSKRPDATPSGVQTQLSQPVATLMAKAESELGAGHLDRSAASLERAIRIEPRNPLLWHRLAAIRLRQGHYVQAESMASKSNSLIDSDVPLARKNWQIIAEVRRLMGDAQGEQKALNHAR